MANSTLGVNSTKEIKARVRPIGGYAFGEENELNAEDAVAAAEYYVRQKAQSDVPNNDIDSTVSSVISEAENIIKEGMSAFGSTTFNILEVAGKIAKDAAKDAFDAGAELFGQDYLGIIPGKKESEENQPKTQEEADAMKLKAEEAALQRQRYTEIAAQQAKAGRVESPEDQVQRMKAAEAIGMSNPSYIGIIDQQTHDLRTDLKPQLERVQSEQERAAARANSPVLVSPSKRGSGPGVVTEAKKQGETFQAVSKLTG